MGAVAQNGRSHTAHHGGGLWVALLVVALATAAVWGAWRLGVMVGEGTTWRRGLPEIPSALRKVPTPPPIPTQRRPTVEPVVRD